VNNFFDGIPEPANPSFSVTVDLAVPSLNQLFAMNHWDRAKHRKQVAVAFKSALLALDTDSLTKIINVRKVLLTNCDTSNSSPMTLRNSWSIKSRKRKSRKAKKKQQP
jgi:hypothetical protein